MANSGDMVVKVNAAELLTLEKDGETVVINPKAEDAILRLLEIKNEVDGAIDYLKEAIARQATEFDPNFSGLKGRRIKINYSAAGAKFKETGEIEKHSSKFWKKKVSWSLDSKAIEAYKAKYYRLPKGISEVVRKKTIRISEVPNE